MTLRVYSEGNFKLKFDFVNEVLILNVSWKYITRIRGRESEINFTVTDAYLKLL